MIGRNRVCLNNFRRLKPLFRQLSLTTSNSAEDNSKIVIPPRIERGPTDILQALASCFGPDPTAAHYKYHDDPYLIPKSNVAKRTFALSQESGRKAAKWIVDQHANLFQHRNADPFIEAYAPKIVYNEDSTVGEDTLIKVIDDSLVSDAVIIYQLLQKNKTELKLSTKQSLLELLCFYNGEDVVSDEWIEERWFRQGTKGSEKIRNVWRNHEVIDSILKEMKEPTAEAYSSVIQGMIKYGNFEQAWYMYEQTTEKNLKLDAGCYNALLRAASVLRESPDLKWKMVTDLLTTMAQENIKPNVRTLNSVLFVISTFNHLKQAVQCSMSILAEFKNLKIELCLTSYYYLMTSLCRDRGPIHPILNDIMDEIDGKEFEIQDNCDVFFFATAMDVCRFHLQDIELAKRVDKLLHTGNNYNLIGDSFKESVYYRNYFFLSCATEPLDTFLTLYNKLVPHIYTPEPAVMEEILKAINMNAAVEHMPKMWSDIILFSLNERESILNLVLEILVNNQPAEDDEATNKTFADIGWDVWEKVESSNAEGRRKTLTLSGKALSDVLILCVRNNDSVRAWEVFKKVEKQDQSIIGDPSVESLCSLFDLLLTKGDVFKALKCVQFCSELGFPEAVSMAKQMKSKLTLPEEVQLSLTSIIGSEES